MSDLTYIQRRSFENLFGMSTGYVLDFGDYSFQEFVFENTNINIDESKYHKIGHSKAKRLREFWRVESNYIVAKLNRALLEYWRIHSYNVNSKEIYEECLRICDSLNTDTLFEHIDSIQTLSNDKDFRVLFNSIKTSIQKDEPEAALDRLHTLVIKFIRELCDKYQIIYDKDKSLNSLFGEYIKQIEKLGRIESEMTRRILKYSITILESFNSVRNNQSLAHANTILNYNESMLIFNNIFSLISFIRNIETSFVIEEKNDTEEDNRPFGFLNSDDLPF